MSSRERTRGSQTIASLLKQELAEHLACGSTHQSLGSSWAEVYFSYRSIPSRAILVSVLPPVAPPAFLKEVTVPTCSGSAVHGARF